MTPAAPQSSRPHCQLCSLVQRERGRKKDRDREVVEGEKDRQRGEKREMAKEN